MMDTVHMIKKIYLVPVILFILSLSACSLPGAVPPTPTLIPVTDTPVPTQTPQPTATDTATPLPTETPTPTVTPLPPLALVPERVTGWCLPINRYVSVEGLPAGTPPTDVTMAQMTGDQIDLLVPGTTCTLVFAVNQPVPAGMMLRLLDQGGGSTVWMELPLQQVSGSVDTVYTDLTHNLIINPPYWEITFPVEVVSSTGVSVWKGNLRMYKALPNPCWDGSLPDPVTMYCPNYDGDWNYKDFPNFNPDADIFDEMPISEDDKGGE